MVPSIGNIITLSLVKIHLLRAQYVDTVFGSGTATFGDGTGTRAHFNNPRGISFDPFGNLYVADTDNHRIRKITPNGEVSVLAGSGVGAFADGQGTKASFLRPYGVTVDFMGTIYVADTYNHRVRKITPLGNVTTLAANGAASNGIAIDSLGNVYVTENAYHRVRKITPGGNVSTLAGSGFAGFADGFGSAARFNNPYELTIESSGNLYVADVTNDRIRKISPVGEVSTIVGSNIPNNLNRPRGIAVDKAGNFIVADTENNLIRTMSPYGRITTIAGSGKIGCYDGNAKDATFNFPYAVAIDASGNIYVSETNNHRIRKIIIADNIPNIKPPHLSDVDIASLGLMITGGTLVAYDKDLLTNSILLGINSETEDIQLRTLDNDQIYESSLNILAATNQSARLLVRISQDKNISSAVQIVGKSTNILQDLACDGLGNTYVTGVYTNNTIFHFSNSSILALPYINSSQAGFIAKFVTSGSIAWIISVEGGPLFLEVNILEDSAIVAIKYAKKPDDQFACIVTPVEGEKLYFNSLNNGVALIRISSTGRVLWSNQVNYAPWDQNQLLSVNRFGDISLTAWCSMPCSWYRNNETNSTFVIPSTNLGAKFVFSANGTLKTGTPLLKFVRIVYGQSLRCRVGLQNAILTILSHASNTSIRIQDATVVDVVTATNVMFISLNGIQRLKMHMARGDEFVASFSPSLEWSTCGRFNSELGPMNVRGNISVGTFVIKMKAQIGFLSTFPLKAVSSDALIRFRPTSRFDFRCGVVNETHGIFLTSRGGMIELSMLLRDESNGSYWGEPIVLTSLPSQSNSLSIYAFILRNVQITIYLNGEQLFQFDLANATDFLMTTFDVEGEFDLMGILALPQSYESWLTFETDSQPDSFSPTFTIEQLDTAVVGTMNSILTETPERDVEKEWSLFGISGLVLYISIGATAFGISFLFVVIAYIVVLRKRRPSTIDETKGQNATLVNSEYKSQAPVFS